MVRKTLATAFPDKARFLGSLAGLILGDIIGSYHEFSKPARRRYPDLNALKHGNNVFGARFGYTDDSILALAAMEAFVRASGRFDTAMQTEHALAYVEHRSPWSPLGRCFDVGQSTYRSLTEGDWLGKTDDAASGNGVLMRLLPFAWHYACQRVPNRYRELDAEQPLDMSELDAVTQLTHGSTKTLETTRDMAEVLVKLLFGFSWKESRVCVEERYPVSKYGHEIDRAKTRTYQGYCEDSLALAISLMDRGLDWEQGIAEILSKGGDTDTNAAIFGQLYGACYPDELRQLFHLHRADIFKADDIELLAEAFIESQWPDHHFSANGRISVSELVGDMSAEALYRKQVFKRERDGMPYALTCPRDCVHYGEGCLLGHPIEQLSHFRRHGSKYRDLIPLMRSDKTRQQWTRTLKRAIPPDAPPCYHGQREATDQCNGVVCGHIPKTVKKALSKE